MHGSQAKSRMTVLILTATKEGIMKQPKTDSLPVSFTRSNAATMEDQVRKLDAFRERLSRSELAGADCFSVEILHVPATKKACTTTLFALYDEDGGRLCGPFADIELLYRYLDIKERLQDLISLAEDSDGLTVEFEALYQFTFINDRYRVSVVDTFDKGDLS
jgi:hypothetical protein